MRWPARPLRNAFLTTVIVTAVAAPMALAQDDADTAVEEYRLKQNVCRQLKAVAGSADRADALDRCVHGCGSVVMRLTRGQPIEQLGRPVEMCENAIASLPASDAEAFVRPQDSEIAAVVAELREKAQRCSVGEAGGRAPTERRAPTRGGCATICNQAAETIERDGVNVGTDVERCESAFEEAVERANTSRL